MSSIREQINRYRFLHHRLELFRGAFSLIALVVLTLSVFAGVEYFFYLSADIKSGLVIFWAVVNIGAFVQWVIRPLLAMYFSVGAISDRKVAVLMGKGDTRIEDKMINFLELEGNQTVDQTYLEALVGQKTRELKNYNLMAGLNPRQVTRAAWIATVPTVLVLIYSAFDSGLFLEGSRRFLDYRTAYVPQAPFEFEADFKGVVEKGQSVDILLSLKGDQIPSRAYIFINGERIPMRTTETGKFSWRVERAVKDLSIRFEAMDFQSEIFSVRVLPLPSLLDFTLQVIPPAHTGVSEFTTDGSGDMVVPEGSDITWSMSWNDADSIRLVSPSGDLSEMSKSSSDSWILRKRVLNDYHYKIQAHNNQGTDFNSGNYDIRTIDDMHPKVEVDFEVDSLTGVIYLHGVSTDDYGVKRTEVEVVSDSTYRLRIAGSEIDWSTVLRDARVKSFTVIVWDNDGVNGSKSSKAGPFDLNLGSHEDREEKLDRREEERIRNMEEFRDRQSESEELQEEMKQQLIDGSSDWRMEQMRRRMERQQEQLLQDWNQMMEDFRQENNERILNDPENESNAERREQLEKLMEEMDQERLKELMEEMKREGENMNEDNLRDWMRRVQNENQRMERDAERLEELMKRLSFEQEVEESMQRLEELQQRQQELSERNDDTRAEQDSLNAEFSEWRDNLDSLEQKNNELKQPTSFETPKDQAEETESSMQESSDQLQQNNQDGANQKQQESSESMSDMLQKMSSSVMQMQMDMHVENLANLRRILTNLIHLSEDQEDLSGEVLEMQSSDRVVVGWMKRQQDLQEGFVVVDDSLTALIARVPMIEAHVTKWLVSAKENMEAGNDELSERLLPRASSDMRESMMALNELSLMLDQTMDQIQQQMSAMMKGNQTCQKPGGGKPSMANMRMQQQQLNQQMQGMGMKPGDQQPGSPNGTPRGEGKDGQGMSAQELVQMMSRQAEIRQMLEDMEGSTGNNGNQQLQEMLEENERDIANRNFDTEFFERQKEIEVKMLELEEAERQQEQDDERRSRTGDRYQELRESREEEFLRKQRQSREQLRFEAPALTPYYRQRASSYLRR